MSLTVNIHKPSVQVLACNEEYWLPYVLKQVEGLFDSYVIYDVGSTDDTSKIIDWFYERNKNKADIFIRKMPMVQPVVQGAFRNAMIAEGLRDYYFILDGDELYKKEDLIELRFAAYELKFLHSDKRYGVVSRVEVTDDLRQQYVERRSHHRLYRSNAIWKGTHPGERAVFKQDSESEVNFPEIVCYHMHNTLRSSKNNLALGRKQRLNQRTYHPGNELAPLDLIKEIPDLAKPIEDFKVNPALEALQNA